MKFCLWRRRSICSVAADGSVDLENSQSLDLHLLATIEVRSGAVQGRSYFSLVNSSGFFTVPAQGSYALEFEFKPLAPIAAQEIDLVIRLVSRHVHPSGPKFGAGPELARIAITGSAPAS